MLFSIIIPIYNVEEYLPECIEAVLRQTYVDYEVILVDDGSPDGCPKICDEYAEKDSRIKVIHKENGGLSDARNSGIQISQGEYIIFIDSDDYWDDDYALEKIQKIILEKKPDVITWRFKKVFEDSSVIKPYGYNISEEKFENFAELIRSRNFIVSACSKAIKKTLFANYNLQFANNVYSEDVEWCARLLAVSDTVIPSNLDFYIYRQRSGSITHTIEKKNVDDLKNHILTVEESIPRVSSVKQEILCRFLAEEFSNFVIAMTRYNASQEEFGWIQEKKYLLKWASSKKSKILKIMLNFIGPKLSIKLISLLR